VGNSFGKRKKKREEEESDTHYYTNNTTRKLDTGNKTKQNKYYSNYFLTKYIKYEMAEIP